MISNSLLLVFVGAALLMALTPGPNMIYLISRSLCQGRAAGIAGWFAKNRFWLAVQRYVMGLVMGALAFKLLSQQRSAA